MRGGRRFWGRGAAWLSVVFLLLAAVPVLAGCGEKKETQYEKIKHEVEAEWEELTPAQERRRLKAANASQRRWEKCPGYAARPTHALGPEGVEVASLRIGCGDVGRWPLKVKSGLLQCEEEVVNGYLLQKVWFTAPDGTAYGVNGTAQDAGYPGIDPIWKDDPAGYGLKISISPLIDQGLKLCESA